MDCSSDDMGYQKRGRTRSHELNMVMVAFVTWLCVGRLIVIVSFDANWEMNEDVDHS